MPSNSAATVDNTLGACLLGVIIASIFYGITCLQTYLYYRRYQHDGMTIKFGVGLLWLLDTLHQVFATHIVYTILVTRNGSPTALLTPPWSVMVNIVVTGVTDVVVRLLFCQRLWMFSKKNYFVVLPVLVGNASSLAGCLAFVIKAAPLDSFPAFRSLSWALYLALGSGVSTDLFLASSLVFFLWKSRTGFRRTDSMVQVLMLYSINTALLTSLCETTSFITVRDNTTESSASITTSAVQFAAMPDTFVYYAFFTILPKLLLNSLLATYNGRNTVREASRANGDLISIPLSSSTYGRSINSGTLDGNQASVCFTTVARVDA
ncbi:hypothetical protein CERSUDRAFT_99686 [Gelatoporia subvermispora B]|uniref:DUF6534 domain-containing protein n=1 Tax=Ceriporiopsis subvermispora (strain B) TaxID=914234 RepID=M2QJK4_CERS8|nr:hypothetical protein CERSUDRAFT_99686 [Gelatoporia subvermispora B]